MTTPSTAEPPNPLLDEVGVPLLPKAQKAIAWDEGITDIETQERISRLAAYVATQSRLDLAGEAQEALREIAAAVAARGGQPAPEDIARLKALKFEGRTDPRLGLLFITASPLICFHYGASRGARGQGAWTALGFRRGPEGRHFLGALETEAGAFTRAFWGCEVEAMRFETMAVFTRQGAHTRILNRGFFSTRPRPQQKEAHLEPILIDPSRTGVWQEVRTQGGQGRLLHIMVRADPVESPVAREPPAPQPIEETQGETPQPATDPLVRHLPRYWTDGASVRRLPQVWLSRALLLLERSRPSEMQHVLLNLPLVLGDTAVGARRPDSHPTPERLGMRFFLAGNYAKAFELLTEGAADTRPLSGDEVRALYPEARHPLPAPGAPSSSAPIQLAFGTVEANIRELKGRKSCGLSGLGTEVLRQLWGDRRGKAALRALVEAMLNAPETMHRQLFQARVVGVPKHTGGVRPIAVEEALTKLTNKVANTLLLAHLRPRIHPRQYCLQAESAQLKAVSEIAGLVGEGYSCLLSVDFSNAYGTIERGAIVGALRGHGVDDRLVAYISHFLARQEIVYLGEDGAPAVHLVTRGVPQGDPMSSTLFCAGVDSLLQRFNEGRTRCLAYADDFVLLARTPEELAGAWASFQQEAEARGLEINRRKSHLLLPAGAPEGAWEQALGLEALHYDDDFTWVYLGIPISQSRALVLAHVEETLGAFMQTAQALWGSRAPVQCKYHLHKMCLVGRLTYYFRGLGALGLALGDIEEPLARADDALLALLPAWIRDVPASLRELPCAYGGCGLTPLRSTALFALAAQNPQLHFGRPDTPWLSAETRDTSIQGIRSQHYKHLLLASPSLQTRLRDPEPWRQSTLIIESPPRCHAQTLSDRELQLFFDRRFAMDHSALGVGGANHCSMHREEPCSLAHISTCNHLGTTQNTRCHFALVGLVMQLLRGRPEIAAPRFEQYSDFQRARLDNGLSAKRADIVYQQGATQHSIDVSVVSAPQEAEGRRGSVLAERYYKKTQQYQGESNVHIVLLSAAADIHPESLGYLRSLGLGDGGLREMQTVIVRHLGYKVGDTAAGQHRHWASVAKGRRRARRHSAGTQTEEGETSHARAASAWQPSRSGN